jgi:hypothetical protein
MKAPSVREGGKENGTQVTGNQIYKGCLVCQLPLADQALPQKIPFMPTSLSQLQAQGWKKWLSRITFTRRTNYLLSNPISTQICRFQALGQLMRLS